MVTNRSRFNDVYLINVGPQNMCVLRKYLQTLKVVRYQKVWETKLYRVTIILPPLSGAFTLRNICQQVS
jgi:hypothetical protein